MEALISNTKRDGGDGQLPYRVTTAPPPEYSPADAYIVEHYSSRWPSVSNTSTPTTITMASSDEMTVAQGKLEDGSSPQPASKHGWRFYAAFGCLCIISLVCALDATSLSVALPIIAKKLNGTAIEAFWSGTSFLLTSTVFQPSFASFSHIFGRRPMVLLALTFFTAGTIISALAHSFAVLLVGRSIQGVGGGGIIALTYVIVTDLVTLRERGKWFGLISMMWAIGSVSGPVIGGAISERVSWRWIFWINLPLCALGFITIPIFLRLHYKVGSFAEKLKQIDWVGTVIFVGSVTSFLIPITWGGVMYEWSSWRTLVPLLVGVGGLVGFILYSKYLRIDRGHDPLIRGSIFRSSTALASYLGTVLHGIIVSSILYYLPLYFEVAKDLSPTMAGVGLFPQTFTVAPASVIVGVLIAKSGKYRWSVWSGWILTTTGMGLLILLTESTSTVEWIFLNLVGGTGIGMLYSGMSFSIQAAASNADLPFAAAMFSFFRAFGQMLGVAIGGAIFQNEMTKKLQAYPELAPLAKTYSNDASALVQIIKNMPAAEDVPKTHLIHAYVDSLRVLWIVMCAFAGFSLVVAVLWVKEHSLERELETDQGFRHDVKLTDSELTLGTTGPLMQDKKLVTHDSQLTLHCRSETGQTPIMEKTIVWKPSERTLGPSSTTTESEPSSPAVPTHIVKNPSTSSLDISPFPKPNQPASSSSQTLPIPPKPVLQRPSSVSSDYTHTRPPSLTDNDTDKPIPAAAVASRDYSDTLVSDNANADNAPTTPQEPSTLPASTRLSRRQKVTKQQRPKT